MSEPYVPNIHACYEMPKGWKPKGPFDCPARGPRPVPIRVHGTHKLQGRKVLETSHHLGSYGMGGPGFFGMKLAGRSGGKDSWLVLTLWGADDWLTLDDAPISFSGSPDRKCPTAPLVGKVLEWAKVQPKYSQMRFGDGEATGTYKFLGKIPDGTWLEFHPSPSKRPLRPNGEQHVLYKGESLLDAWVVAKQMYLYI